MDFLNRAFAQVRDLFQSMTPGGRIVSGLLLTVIVVSLAYLFTHQVSGSDEYLMGGESFTVGELQAMQAAFGKAGLTNYRPDGARIRIPHGKHAEYMAALADNDALPAHFGKFLSDTIQGDSPFLTRQQRAERRKIATEKELSLIIRKMPGIEEASVLSDMQSEGGLQGTIIKSASVAVKPLGTGQLDQDQVRKVRHLVAAAFAGMKPEDVTVADINGQVYTGSGDVDSGGSAAEDAYIARKREHEKDWQAKILKALSYVPGVNVSVNVELDRQKFLQTEDVKHDPKTVAFRTTEKEKTATREGGGPGGRPGYVAQQPKANAATTVQSRRAGMSEQEEESEADTINAVSSTRTRSEDIGLTPKMVKAAIGVPASYFVKVWQKENPPAPGEEPKMPDKAELTKIKDAEMKRIRVHAATVLPAVVGMADATELVTVTDFQDIPAAVIPDPSMTEKALTFLGQYWATLGMLALAGFSLLMLRSMTRAALPPLPKPYVKPGDISDQAEETAAQAAHLGRFATGAASLRDELSELVAEDPDAAANILRAWIGAP